MELISLLAAIPPFAISCIATFLALHHHYEDGVIGHIGLAGMAVTGFILVLMILSNDEPHWKRAAMAMMGFMALFLGRHCYRFLKFREPKCLP